MSTLIVRKINETQYSFFFINVIVWLPNLTCHGIAHKNNSPRPSLWCSQSCHDFLGRLGAFSRWDVVVGPLEPAPYMANAKIAVNMPVFFLIGGYLAFSTFQHGVWSKILARVVGFLWPMASFGFVFALVYLSYKGWQGWRWLVWFPVKQVLYGHWFLRTFSAIYLLSAIVYSLFKTDGKRSIVFMALYIILLFHH